jgi:hypothetical protein
VAWRAGFVVVRPPDLCARFMASQSVEKWSVSVPVGVSILAPLRRGSGGWSCAVKAARRAVRG